MRWCSRLGLFSAMVLAQMLASGNAPGQAIDPQMPTTRASPEILQYLGATNISLLDWGMFRLERELDKAVRRLDLDRAKGGAVRVGTQFRFSDRRILAYLSVPSSGSTRSPSYCRDLFRVVREELLAGAPGGAEGAEWYLNRLFTSDIRRDPNAPADLGRGLVDLVHLEITLRAPAADAFSDGPANVACAGRLDAVEAYIVVPWRPQG